MGPGQHRAQLLHFARVSQQQQMQLRGQRCEAVQVAERAPLVSMLASAGWTVAQPGLSFAPASAYSNVRQATRQPI
jgi:hypothetical protein